MKIFSTIRYAPKGLKLLKKLRQRDERRAERRLRKLEQDLQRQKESELTSEMIEVHKAAAFWGEMNKELEQYSVEIDGSMRIAANRLSAAVKYLVRTLSEIDADPNETRKALREHQRRVIRLQEKLDSRYVPSSARGQLQRKSDK